MMPSDSQARIQPFKPPNPYALQLAKQIIDLTEMRMRTVRSHLDNGRPHLAEREEQLWRGDVLESCTKALDAMAAEREWLLQALIEPTAYSIKPVILCREPSKA